jgi:hypothetical protein
VNGGKRAQGSTVSSQKVIISLLSGDLTQHTRNHLIEDLTRWNAVTPSITRSYPKYHEKHPSLAALNATYAPKPSTRPYTKEVINARQ